MLLLSPSRTEQEQGARPSRCHQMGTGRADMETPPTSPTPCSSQCFYSRKVSSLKKPGCPKLYCQCTPRGRLHPHRLAGKSHKAEAEPSHRKSLLKQREELQKANSVSTEKKLILCSCLNKLYSFPSGTFIPVYSTTSEII